MSISPAACGEIRPDDCAVVRTSLVSKFLSSEKLLQRPVELDDDKKKTPCFCVLEQGVFALDSTIKDSLIVQTDVSDSDSRSPYVARIRSAISTRSFSCIALMLFLSCVVLSSATISWRFSSCNRAFSV